MRTIEKQISPQIFTIWSNEIKGRIDPYFYKPEFAFLENKLLKINYKLLGDIISFSDETWNQKDNFDDKFPYIEISEIDTITGEIKNIIYYDKKKAPSRAKMIIRENDIIVSTTRPNRGAISFIDKSKDGFIASTGFAILRSLKIKEIDKKYLFYFLKTNLALNQMLQRSSGGNYPAITAEELQKIIVPIPPLQIQNQIVSIIQKAYEEKKEKEAEAGKLLGSIDDYVLGELGIKMLAFKTEMVFEVWSGEVENNRLDANYWQPFLEEIKEAVNKGKYKTQKLKNFITKIHYGASTSNAYVDKGIPFLRIQNLKPNFLDISEVVYLPESFRKKLGNAFVKTGDMLISRSGTVGVVSVMPKEANEFAFGSFMIKLCLNAQINKEFVSVWLNTKLNKLLTEREKIGAIQGNITIGTIENFDIPFSPLSIQNKIAKEVRSRMQKAERLQAEAKEVLEKAKEKAEAMILR